MGVLRSLLALGLISGIVACAQILGIEDARKAEDGRAASRDADAAEVDAASCSVDLGTDGHNCGRCGHDCRGGRCESGRCAPSVVFEAGQLVERGRSFTGDVAVADGRIVFRDTDGVTPMLRACALESCVPVGLAIDVGHMPVIVGGEAYLESRGVDAIDATPLDRGTVAGREVVSFTSQSDVTGVKVVGLDPVAQAILYDVERPGAVHELQSCIAPDCAAGQTIAKFSGSAMPWSNAFADASNVYAMQPAREVLTSCPKGGCGEPPEELSYRLGDVLAFAGDTVVGTRAERGVIVACTLPRCADGRDVHPEPDGVEALRTDGTWVYWSSTKRVISRCRIDDCAQPEVLYRGALCVACGALGLALEGDTLVWAEPATLYRLVLPP